MGSRASCLPRLVLHVGRYILTATVKLWRERINSIAGPSGCACFSSCRLRCLGRLGIEIERCQEEQAAPVDVPRHISLSSSDRFLLVSARMCACSRLYYSHAAAGVAWAAVCTL